MSLPDPATSSGSSETSGSADRPGPKPENATNRAGFPSRWIPCYGTAGLLLILAGIAAALRVGIVAAKPLARAKERWAFIRQDSSKGSLKWEDAAVLGTHWSTLAALALLAAAFLTMRWWVPRRRKKNNISPDDDAATTSSATAAASGSGLAAAPVAAGDGPRLRWFGPALLALIILAGALRLPLASGSLWWDELWNIKYATVGEWKQEPLNPDVVTFQSTSWPRAAWYYNKPTNHPVLTLPSKLAHETWRAITRPANPGAFNETVLRLPVLLAGLAAIFLTATLTRRLAGDRAALFAAAVMAIHPWLLRYGVDARSYGMAVFFIALSLTSLERATHPDSRRAGLWWWLFGACQFFLMWSHVVAHLAVCAGLCAAAAWLIIRSKSPDRFQNLVRLLVINALAAAFLLVAFLPNLLQALTWGERNDDGNLLTGSYFIRTLGQICGGMETPPGPGTEGIPFLPWWGLALLGVGGITAIISGTRYLIARQPRAAWIVLSVIAATAVFLTFVRLTDFYFYHRFILVAAMPVMLLAGIGLSRLRLPWAGVGALGIFAFLTFPQIRLLTTRSYAPFRETVADIRDQASRMKGEVIPVGYGLGSHVMQCYFPQLRDIRSDPRQKLQALIDQARKEERPLIVALGYEGLNRLNQPEGFALLDDPALFQKVGTRHGIEPEFTFHLFTLLAPTGTAVKPAEPAGRPDPPD